MPEENNPFDKVCRVIATENTQAAITTFRDLYALAHVTLHMAQTVSSDIHMPFLKTTYPSDWVSRYVLKGYANIDPIVSLGFNRQLAFDWREIEQSIESKLLMKDSLRFGLGKNGFSIPIIDKSGRKTLISLNSHLPDEEWDKETKTNQMDWTELAHDLHIKAIYERYGNRDPAPRLGPRELQCLRLAAEGHNYKGIAKKIFVSEHTVRDYLKSLRQKLECRSISQAISKAHELGIL